VATDVAALFLHLSHFCNTYFKQSQLYCRWVN